MIKSKITKKWISFVLLSLMGWFDFIPEGLAASIDATDSVSISATVLPLEERNQAYLLSTEGEVFGVGGAPVFSPNPLFPGQELARALAVSPGTRGYYILQADGNIIAFGDALPFGIGRMPMYWGPE